MRGVQLDEYGSICAIIDPYFDDGVSIPIDDEESAVLDGAEDIRDYTVSEDGRVVLNENPYVLDRKRAEDTAKNFQSDTDAALFDLADYIASLEERIERLEAMNG